MRFYSKNLIPRNEFDYLDKFLADFLAYPTTTFARSNNALNTDVYENEQAYYLCVVATLDCSGKSFLRDKLKFIAFRIFFSIND